VSDFQLYLPADSNPVAGSSQEKRDRDLPELDAGSGPILGRAAQLCSPPQTGGAKRESKGQRNSLDRLFLSRLAERIVLLGRDVQSCPFVWRNRQESRNQRECWLFSTRFEPRLDDKISGKGSNTSR